MNHEVFRCPGCLSEAMRAGVDRKGRPYFRCSACSAILFVRTATLGLHTVAHTLRLLNDDEAAERVRTRAANDATTCDQSLKKILGVASEAAHL